MRGKYGKIVLNSVPKSYFYLREINKNERNSKMSIEYKSRHNKMYTTKGRIQKEHLKKRT